MRKIIKSTAFGRHFIVLSILSSLLLLLSPMTKEIYAAESHSISSEGSVGFFGEYETLKPDPSPNPKPNPGLVTDPVDNDESMKDEYLIGRLPQTGEVTNKLFQLFGLLISLVTMALFFYRKRGKDNEQKMAK